MYVVLGANGRAGGEVARALIERGEAVRVVLRRKEQAESWKALGAEVAIASIGDGEAMVEALKGASAAFLLNPPPVSGDPYAVTEELGAALAAVARRAHLPKAVVLSSIGAQHAAGTGVIATLNRFEALLDGVAPTTAFLRCGYFVETWGEAAQSILSDSPSSSDPNPRGSQGRPSVGQSGRLVGAVSEANRRETEKSVLPSFIEPSLKIPMVSTIDVGRTAAGLLCEEWTGRRIVEVAQDWSAADIASAFSQVLGRQVTPVLVRREDRAALLAGEGVPEEVAEALLGMYEGIANGLFTREESNEHRRGTVSLTTAIGRLVPRSR